MLKLLVPVDFSASSASALLFGIQLANDLGGEVTVLNAFQLKTRNGFQSVDAIVKLEKELVADGRSRLEAFIQDVIHRAPWLPKDVAVPKGAVRIGFAIEEIISVSEQYGFDFIVMGTKGATNLKDKFLGSSTSTVIDNVEVPVITVPSGNRYDPIRRIGYMIRQDNPNMKVIERLTAFAKPLEAELRMLFLGDENSLSTEGLKQEFLAELKRRLAYDKITMHLLQGLPQPKAIDQFIREQEFDLLAVNTADPGLSQRLISTTLVREMNDGVTFPVLAVQP